MTYRWLLPEYLEDVLPDEAWHMEDARRTLLDVLRRRSYELVIPPLLEFTESLVVDSARDMEDITFRLVDQLSGRQLGLRPDMTLQAARIDAHRMQRAGANRLCYAGPVVHTHPEGLNRSREPFQVGAELYGVGGIEGDLEILALMLECLGALGLSEVVLDVGQVGVFRHLAQASALSPQHEKTCLDLLQRGDVGALQHWAETLGSPWGERLAALSTLHGEPREVLAQARQRLAGVDGLEACLQPLEQVLQLPLGKARMSFDLAQLRGYHYHSGLVFAVYGTGFPEAIARGGRYDDIGQVFGQARPAVGFSLDLKALLPAVMKKNKE
ncbi:MAG: ATP phosphoribosyltransferase regulatory subunit [Ferrovum sp.]|nr:ATP phosphoribosyltransferase regulatory subunit [Ferrovum sp.]